MGCAKLPRDFPLPDTPPTSPTAGWRFFLQGDREEVEAMEKEIGESHLAGFIREVTGGETEAVSGRRGFQIL